MLILGCTTVDRYEEQRYLKKVKTLLEDPEDVFSTLKNDFSLFNGTTDSANKLLPKFIQAREDLIEARQELKKSEPPEKYERYHQDMLDNLQKGDKLYHELAEMAKYIIKSDIIIIKHIEDNDAFKIAYKNAVDKEQKITLIQSYKKQSEDSLSKIKDLSLPKKFIKIKKEEISYFKSLINLLDSLITAVEQGNETDIIRQVTKKNNELTFDRVKGENAKAIGATTLEVESIVSTWDELKERLEELEESK